MKVMVLGAGVTGITTAWYLAQRGHEVTVVERRGAAAMETSFANGGQISVSHAEPWANPGAPLKVLQWLAREDAPLLFRLRADVNQWLWGLEFLRNCTPARTAENIKQIVSLGMYSRGALQKLRAELGLQYDAQTKGILHFYTSQAEYDAAQEPARIMREHGCELDMKTADECVAIEPALAQCRSSIVGGSMTPSDESGDAQAFTTALAARCEQAGVKFLYNTTVLGLDAAEGQLNGVQVAMGRGEAGGKVEMLKADAYVMCLGAFSAQWAKVLGQSLRIYPAKGYSVTLPVINEAASYQVSLTDDEYKLVFSRFGNRLRIAGTAELNGYNTELNLVRCNAIVRRVKQLFPEMTDGEGAQFWTGLRPATPSNVPYIGKSRASNVFLNTGHGTLGWTHACGSGAAIADIVSGRVPEVDFAFTGMPKAGRVMALPGMVKA
ncbi:MULTISPECIES: D-amino acid dehydrogenase [unclassified Polaromonas]|uniref:D-amino acid dehydrogenase n=1 Tax=unclassified Polaromonas TaxID=2638319 RepID=UPI000F08AA56|nr:MULTISPECIES: D-amino acid dehydrogenase [unclassified Polaromonas]AYQ30387.1 D-amino acid dehydrogenase [Polaromonas sp. SP1]QGJ17646.1 FAD-dependent oxidoreductase [Polaromonas sp. Pch-P]